ncbi:MAG: ferritin [Candidatus Eisenbacteria bacterium]|nr:ferritin [Candidatus Eisenbacteria bacterium]
MSEYHEPLEALPEGVRDVHRALRSLIEELEAVDWYHQRAAATEDAELQRIVEHNRDEEIEHACMALEWLRRRMPGWDAELRTYLFTSGDITSVEESGGAGESDPPSERQQEPARRSSAGDLGLGNLREEAR